MNDNTAPSVASGYHAAEIVVSFSGWIDGALHDANEYEADIESWRGSINLGDVIAGAGVHDAAVSSDIALNLSRLTEHYASVGAFRWDGATGGSDDGYIEQYATISYFLVTAGDLPSSSLEKVGLILGSATDRAIPNTAFPGAFIMFKSVGTAVDPAELYASLQSRTLATGVGPWGGTGTPNAFPMQDENQQAWLARIAISADAVSRTLDKWETVGRDPELFVRYLTFRDDAKPNFLVPGIIEFGVVSTIVGSGAVGKSSLGQELLSAAGGKSRGGPKTWLGQTIDGRYPTALFCGEEADWIIEHRRAKHETVWSDCECLVFPGGPDDLVPNLSLLERLPPGVLVVDSFQAFSRGDDTKSHIASEFYSPLTQFARRSGWAVVVLHHLVKSPATSFNRMIASVKGSTVHTDRSRMVIAMIDRGGGTVEIAPIKHNLPQELVWTPTNEGRLYRRDPETYTLAPIGVAPTKIATPAASCDDKILQLIERSNASGVIVRRTGKSGLFDMRAPELAGLSRAVIVAAADQLIASGRIVVTTDGLKMPIELQGSANQDADMVSNDT